MVCSSHSISKLVEYVSEASSNESCNKLELYFILGSNHSLSAIGIWCDVIVHVPINLSDVSFHLTRSNFTGLNSTNQNKISMEDQTQLDEILNELLNNDNYFQSPPPKSTSTPAPPSSDMVPSHGSLTTHSGTFQEDTDKGSAK